MYRTPLIAPGELRVLFGIQLRGYLLAYDLEVEAELDEVLPPEVEDDDNAQLGSLQ